MAEWPLCSNVTLLHFTASFKFLPFWHPHKCSTFYIVSFKKKKKKCNKNARVTHLNLFNTNAVVLTIVKLKMVTSGTVGEPVGIDRLLCCKYQVSELFPQRGWLVVLTVRRLTFIPSVAEPLFPPSAPFCCHFNLLTNSGFWSSLQVFILRVCHLAVSKAQLHRL